MTAEIKSIAAGIFNQELPMENSVFWWTGGILLMVLATAFLANECLRRTGTVSTTLHRELLMRIRTWAIIIPAVMLPIGLGPIGVRLATAVLGFLCFREFSRASGLAADRWLSRVAVLAVVILAASGLNANRTPLVIAAVFVALALAGLISGKLDAYLSRVSLAAVAVMWFGICLGTLGDIAAQEGRYLTVLWLILCVEVNDVAAFIGGKIIRGPRLCPNISPGKTISGAVTALTVTTLFGGISAAWYWEIDSAWQPYVLSFCVSLAGQLGDLVVSAVKRGLGIKDTGHSLPGHGGILDRFDSLLIASPIALIVFSVPFN